MSKNIQSIADLISLNATLFSDKIALEYNTEQMTYRELELRANGVANFVFECMRSLEIKESEPRIVVFGQCCPDFIVSIVAVLKCGGIFIPLDPLLPSKRIGQLINEVMPDLIISTSEHASNILVINKENKLDIPIVILDKKEELISEQNLFFYKRSYDSRSLNFQTVFNNPCYIFFTSGSTGTPKGVLGQQQSLIHFLQWEINQFQLDSNTKISQLTPVTFDPFLRDVFVPLLAGGTCCIIPRDIRLDAVSLFKYLTNSNINLVHIVPSLFKNLLLAADDAANSLKPDEIFPCLNYFLLAGELLRGADIKPFFDIFGDRIQLVNLYGPTETTLAKFFYLIQPSDGQKNIIPVGKPLPDTEGIILNEELLPCLTEQAGMLYIKTAYMSLGYLKKDSGDGFMKDPRNKNSEGLLYCTGDVAKLNTDRNMEILGRIDNQVKIRGNRVDITEVENRLLLYPNIKQAIVKVNSQENTVYLCGYFTAKNKINIPDLKRYLSEWLPSYMIPSHFIPLEHFPLTSSGKVDRKSLILSESLLESPEENIILPRTELEVQIHSLWQKVLNLKQISITDDFFNLGGNSLTGMQLAFMLAKTFSIEFFMKDLFENASIERLATFISQKQIKPSSSLPKKYLSPENPGKQENTWFPLGYNQFYNYWLSRLHGNLCFAVKFEGRLNKNALEQAINATLVKHPILRASISPFFPKQIIRSVAKIDIKAICIENLSDHEQLEKIDSHIRKLKTERFNFTSKTLINTYLYRLSELKHVLIFQIDHIVFDAFSKQILADDLKMFYQHFDQKIALKEEQPANSFQTIIKEKNELYLNAMEKGVDFWQQYLQEEAILKVGNNLFNNDLVDYEFVIPKSHMDSLKACCQKKQITMAMAIYAIIVLGIYSLSYQEQILFLTVNSARYQIDSQNTIGNLLQYNLIKLKINPNDSVYSFFEKTKNEILAREYYNHFGTIGLALLSNMITEPSSVSFGTKFYVLLTMLSTLISKNMPSNKKMYDKMHEFILKTLTQKKKKNKNDIHKHKLIPFINFVYFTYENETAGNWDENLHVTLDHLLETDRELANNFTIYFEIYADPLGNTKVLVSGPIEQSYKQKMGNFIINLIEKLAHGDCTIKESLSFD